MLNGSAQRTQLWVDHDDVFTDETGNAINPRRDWDRWKKLLWVAGVRDGRLHDARRTAAMVLLLLGVHERIIMSVLGWSTTAMASRYTHVIGSIHKDLAARLDGCLGPAKEQKGGTIENIRKTPAAALWRGVFPGQGRGGGGI